MNRVSPSSSVTLNRVDRSDYKYAASLVTFYPFLREIQRNELEKGVRTHTHSNPELAVFCIGYRLALLQMIYSDGRSSFTL